MMYPYPPILHIPLRIRFIQIRNIFIINLGNLLKGIDAAITLIVNYAISITLPKKAI